MIERIISGAQTGADRGALNAAIVVGIPHGGWCPKGRKAEDGAIPDQYQVKETESANYQVRTEKNVLDADATVIIASYPLGPGTVLTLDLCLKHRRRVMIIQTGWSTPQAAVAICTFITENNVKVLNVAGSRESRCPGIQTFTGEVMTLALTRLKKIHDEAASSPA